MIYVKVIDQKEKVIEIKDLSDIGVEMAIYDCKRLLKELENEQDERR